MERKKLIITGHARTGTTALSDLLNIDGRLFITPECQQFLPEINAQNIYINTTAKSNVLRMDSMFQRHNLSWSDLWPENARRSKFNQWLHKNLNKSVEYIGDKTPRPYLHNIEQIIQKSEYNISVIICIRDGRDCVISKFWGDNAYPHTMKTKDHNLNKVWDTGRNKVVESWISSMKIIQNLLLNENKIKYKIIRYEDSCENPNKTVEDISEFLGFSECLKIEKHKYRPVNKQIWRKKFPNMSNDISKMYPEFQELLDYFDYL